MGDCQEEAQAQRHPDGSARLAPVQDAVDIGLGVVVGPSDTIVDQREYGVEKAVQRGMEDVVQPPWSVEIIQ